jgi:hypothetical protein
MKSLPKPSRGDSTKSDTASLYCSWSLKDPNPTMRCIKKTGKQNRARMGRVLKNTSAASRAANGPKRITTVTVPALMMADMAALPIAAAVTEYATNGSVIRVSTSEATSVDEENCKQLPHTNTQWCTVAAHDSAPSGRCMRLHEAAPHLQNTISRKMRKASKIMRPLLHLTAPAPDVSPLLQRRQSLSPAALYVATQRSDKHRDAADNQSGRGGTTIQ